VVGTRAPVNVQLWPDVCPMLEIVLTLLIIYILN